MLRYLNTQVYTSEIPDELSLGFSILGCNIHCPNCHSQHVWDINSIGQGKELTYEELEDKVKNAKTKVKNLYNWGKIAQDTHFTYQKAICETMAEKQRKQLEQEKAQKTKKAKGTEKEITNLLSFRKRQAYA